MVRLRARSADYHRLWLEQTGAEWPNLSNTERAPGLANIGNVRAALHWCFGPNGDSRLGISLAAAAAPGYLAMSLLIECQRWSTVAIHALDETGRGGTTELSLQKALACPDIAAMYAARNNRGQASAIQQPVFDKFTEGLDTKDLKAAGLVLKTLC